MRLAVHAMLSFALIGTLGCASSLFGDSGKESALEDAQRKYTELVRWGEIDRASFYVDPSMANDYRDAAKRFEDLHFTNFESGALQFGEGSNTATVHVVYHVYSTKTLVEKTIRERQEWYREASAADGWRVRPNLAAIASELSGAR